MIESELREPKIAPRLALRIVLAALYLVAGFAHIKSPNGFLAVTPDWVPFPREVIFLTGLCEIAGASGLLTRRFRRAAGAMLALYAVCVFPANIKHALDGISVGGIPNSWWYHGPRLAFQPVFVWWALFAGGLIDCAFRRPDQQDGCKPELHSARD